MLKQDEMGHVLTGPVCTQVQCMKDFSGTVWSISISGSEVDFLIS